ncbi:MAG: rubrerythrin family protein, partial [Dehalococcoidia bacterium]
MEDQAMLNRILVAQRNELTEYFIYKKLSHSVRDTKNSKILKNISEDELRHHDLWKQLTSRSVNPYKFKIWFFYIISKIFGITFAIKLMEMGEGEAQINYGEIAKTISSAGQIMQDENDHENELIAMIDEERLRYLGAVVRGMNEALVELTGVLSGLTLAFQESNLIVAAGLITGLAMSLSLGGTEYLATKSEETHQRPLKAALYTSFTNFITVLFLIYPYMVFSNLYLSLGIMLLNAIIVIYIFNYYVSVAKEVSFRRSFLEMALISLGIAAITFAIGYLV